VACSATETVVAVRATVRPPASLIRDRTSASRGVPVSFTTEVRTSTSARSSVMSGIVTYVSQRATCTGSVPTRRASR
jgi:hypothetical protein